MIVVCTSHCRMFGCVPGRRCFVRRTFFRNGEHHHVLICEETGESFESSAILWEDA